MCNLSDGIEMRGVRKGMEKGRQEEALRNIRSLMENAKLSAEKALKILNIAAENRPQYVRLLANNRKDINIHSLTKHDNRAYSEDKRQEEPECRNLEA